jgi:putative SOS response-associated peptidase YedK
MCGRYELTDVKLASKFRGYEHNFVDLQPNFNVAPTQTMPVATVVNGHKQLELMHWGIPRMIGPDKVKEIINTRADKAFERFWGSTVLHKRCLVPANGFYEWKTTSEGKQPYFIHPTDQDTFAFAGIWSEWKTKEGEVLRTYSIMTTEPNKVMQDIHNRMPVILHEEDYDNWLTETDDRKIIEPLLRPYEDNRLEAYMVDKTVNSVRNNSKDLLIRL